MSDYKKSGVDTDAADAWVENLEKLTNTSVGKSLGAQNLKKKLISGIGEYAALFELTPNQLLALSCDGVGTKLLWTIDGLGTPEDLAVDLLAMNANDVLCTGATPTLFLDYLAVSSKDQLKPGALLHRFVAGLATACAESNQLLVGGETAQMPDLYEPGHFDAAGFSLGFMRPEERLGVDLIVPGASVWGWESSGPHSNGFSWLRKIFDREKDAAFITQHLMPPTRLFVNDFAALRRELDALGANKKLLAAFHITGSGFMNLLRTPHAKFKLSFELSSFPQKLPEWVEQVEQRTGASREQLFRALNMGFGFVLLFDPSLVEAERILLNSKGLKHLGSLESGDRDQVVLPGQAAGRGQLVLT